MPVKKVESVAIINKPPPPPKPRHVMKKYTMQNLEKMSYKDLKECEGFDPKSLLVYDRQQDPAVTKKFPLSETIPEENVEVVRKKRKVKDKSLIAKHHPTSSSVDNLYNSSFSPVFTFQYRKPKSINTEKLAGSLLLQHLGGNSSTRKASNNSLEKAKQVDLQSKAKAEKVSAFSCIKLEPAACNKATRRESEERFRRGQKDQKGIIAYCVSLFY